MDVLIEGAELGRLEMYVVVQTVIGDFDVVRIIFDLKSVQHAEMLKIDRVGQRHPMLDREVSDLDGTEGELGLGKPDEAWDSEERFGSVECPDQSPLLGGGELEQTRLVGNAIAGRNLRASSVHAILPVMEGATDVVADHLADTQVRSQVTAEGAQHARLAVFSAIQHHSTIEKILADDLTALEFTGETEGVPVLVVPVRPLRGHRRILSFPRRL